nr:unnamed protein product [Digitaria exilis]
MAAELRELGDHRDGELGGEGDGGAVAVEEAEWGRVEGMAEEAGRLVGQAEEAVGPDLRDSVGAVPAAAGGEAFVGELLGGGEAGEEEEEQEEEEEDGELGLGARHRSDERRRKVAWVVGLGGI